MDTGDLIEEAFLLQAITYNLELLDEALGELKSENDATGWGSILMFDGEILEDSVTATLQKTPGGLIRIATPDDLEL
jgi:hypothetical protein